MDANMQAAAQTYLDRHFRVAHPKGNFDKAGRWSPAKTEHCQCCDGIRQPSRAWPFSLMLHCRSIRHVASLYSVDYVELRKAIKAIQG